MKIKIAGAGSGKTTTIADDIIRCYESGDKQKNIYCIAFTNNAVDCIKRKIGHLFGKIPNQIHISTIHAFLFNEIIRPYYPLMYGRQIKGITDAKITDTKYKKATFSRYEEQGILHVEAIPERAKWTVVKKSTDKKADKDKRRVIIQTFKKYCEAIFLDEAQDIDDDVYEIIRQLDLEGIPVFVMGDPKQDLKGYKNLRRLEEEYKGEVQYITKCFRCPQKHLDISNTLIPEAERQTSCIEKTGLVEYIYESLVDFEMLCEAKSYDLKFISMKNERFNTHKNVIGNNRSSVEIEINRIFQRVLPEKSSLVRRRSAYRLAQKMTDDVVSGKEVRSIISKFSKLIGARLDPKTEYGPLAGALSSICEDEKTRVFYIPSIEAVKGMEGDNCLFVLTTDLAEYLFHIKEADNKTKNKLYVALTRSSYALTILISKEVEDKYGKEYVDDFFQNMIS